ncbi:MCE family protein [Pseudonocardia spinosispora]|uniref:MCE family protein n=1 Tax=Pseudonocardia spinosispora TaxID=103441 RepID=UPI00041DE5BB|nr:MlaD family protein [Pseudonocardia spinosispora]
MIARFVRFQLLALSIISVVFIGAVVFVYAKVPVLLGYNQSTLKVHLSNASGLYPNAKVTYRGAEIGKVTAMDLAPQGGAEVVMQVRSDIKVPVDTNAEVHSVSAVGEQYIDLIPRGAAGPYLADGATIPRNRTTLPKQIAPVLQNVDNLLASVPTKSLNTVVDEFGKAFNNTGPSLGTLLDNANLLTREADANYPQTKQLIDQAGTLLDTQTTSSANIRAWTKDLAQFSDQLRDSDGHLRGTLDHAPDAAYSVDDVFQDFRPTLPILLSNLTTVNEVAAIYNKSIEQILVIAPRIFAAEQGWMNPKFDGATAFDLKFNQDNPQTCSVGYAKQGEHLGYRPPDDLADMKTRAGSYCQLPQNDHRVVRGARNLPCQEGPPGRRAASPWECRGDGYRTMYSGAPQLTAGNPAVQLPAPPTPPGAAGHYDPSNGKGVGPDGAMFILGGVGESSPGKKEATWQNLMMDPVAK